MRTIIECPYCRKPVTIVRKVAQGHEILENVQIFLRKVEKIYCASKKKQRGGKQNAS